MICVQGAGGWPEQEHGPPGRRDASLLLPGEGVPEEDVQGVQLFHAHGLPGKTQTHTI